MAWPWYRQPRLILIIGTNSFLVGPKKETDKSNDLKCRFLDVAAVVIPTSENYELCDFPLLLLAFIHQEPIPTSTSGCFSYSTLPHSTTNHVKSASLSFNMVVVLRICIPHPKHQPYDQTNHTSIKQASKQPSSIHWSHLHNLVLTIMCK